MPLDSQQGDLTSRTVTNVNGHARLEGMLNALQFSYVVRRNTCVFRRHSNHRLDVKTQQTSKKVIHEY